MSDILLNTIRELAHFQRKESFVRAAQFVIQYRCQTIVETGCYRGIPQDGQSTAILAMLAREVSGTLDTFDISQDSIDRAMELLKRHNLTGNNIRFHHGDSVMGLALSAPRNVRFAYLDSFDHDEKNPGPCQRHQLAELGAIYGRMNPPCAILMDDNISETGGKPVLAAAFLADRGWKKLCNGYQLLYALE